MSWQHEDQHKALFGAHWDIQKASNAIHACLVALHGAGRYAETREKFRSVIEDLEKARDQLDAASQSAAKGRSELIRQTGCDGSCSNVTGSTNLEAIRS